jgi:hypothetical protein
MLLISLTFSVSVQPLAPAFSAMVGDVEVVVDDVVSDDVCMCWRSACGYVGEGE